MRQPLRVPLLLQLGGSAMSLISTYNQLEWRAVAVRDAGLGRHGMTDAGLAGCERRIHDDRELVVDMRLRELITNGCR